MTTKARFNFEDVIISNPSTEPASEAIKLTADQIAIAEFLAKKPATTAPSAEKAKAGAVTLASVSAPAAPKATPAAKAPATMTVNGQNVPTNGSRRDDCYGCLPKDTPNREKVNPVWAMTWEDTTLTTPIYVCKSCGRIAPRTIRNPK